MSKRWVYHKTNPPLIINDEEWDEFHDDGWSDTPATFIKLDELGIDPDDPAAVQEFGTAIEAIKDEVNRLTNVDIGKMNHKKLIKWAKDNMDIEFPDAMSHNHLKKKVKEFVALSA